MDEKHVHSGNLIWRKAANGFGVIMTEEEYHSMDQQIDFLKRQVNALIEENKQYDREITRLKEENSNLKTLVCRILL